MMVPNLQTVMRLDETLHMNALSTVPGPKLLLGATSLDVNTHDLGQLYHLCATQFPFLQKW